MSWVDSLASEDIQELRDLLHMRPRPKFFVMYVAVALLIRTHGPLPPEQVENIVLAWGGDAWKWVYEFFELRSDGCLHIKGRRS